LNVSLDIYEVALGIIPERVRI